PITPYFTSYQPLLLDMAIHHFDLVRYLLGEDPVLVDCRAFSPPWSPFRDPAAATAVLEFPSGAVVSYRASWVSPSPRTNWAGDWRVECEGGEVSWTSRDDQSVGAADRVAVRRRGRKTARALTLPVVEKYDRSGTLAEFATAIREGREPESSGRDNLATLITSLAAIRSATEGRPVSLEEVLGA
ncbi:MAG TPA: Gfo/Idh/MocA family oxidoreductase, partial [Deinococcales bacterium]|nr:Gfo/Idh/MocA family oxidoreductase [Deinococcales bacterium]